jgi:hypothetical protein
LQRCAHSTSCVARVRGVSGGAVACIGRRAVGAAWCLAAWRVLLRHALLRAVLPARPLLGLTHHRGASGLCRCSSPARSAQGFCTRLTLFCPFRFFSRQPRALTGNNAQAAAAGPMAGGRPCPGPLPRPRRRAALLARVAALCAALQVAAGAASQLACETPGRDAASCAALGDLYAATGGASWAARAGWRDASAGRATDYCSFTGVTCDANGAVTQLCATLTNSSATPCADAAVATPQGADPERLDRLPPDLDVGAEQPDDAVRATCVPLRFMRLLTRLARSDVSDNVLTGTLPRSLGSLGSLTSLCVRAARRAMRCADAVHAAGC